MLLVFRVYLLSSRLIDVLGSSPYPLPRYHLLIRQDSRLRRGISSDLTRFFSRHA